MTIAKAVMATLVAIGGALVTALGTGGGTFSTVDGRHWVLALIAVLGSGAITWWTENGPWHPYIKAVVAFLTAGFGAAAIALNDNHISQAEWVTIAMAAIIALAAVFQTANGVVVPTAQRMPSQR